VTARSCPQAGTRDRSRLSRTEVARAVPCGSRRTWSQPEALRRGLSCPDLAGVRADFRGHLEDWWRIHVCHASWAGHDRPPRGISEPTRARVCELAGMSASTYKACRRWWEERGYVAIVRRGSTPGLRPAALASPADGNVRQAYVLCVPREKRPAPRRAALRPLTRPLSKSRRDSDRFPAREAAAGEKEGRPEPGMAPRPPMLYRGPLRGLTDGWWAHVTAPFAAWSASDIVWAVDHLPGGRQHRTRTANVRHPAGWLRWRLSHWLSPDGTAMPSPSQQRVAAAERHRAYLERRDRELGLAGRAEALRAAGGYESAVPAPQADWVPPRCAHRPGPRPAGWAARRSGPEPTTQEHSGTGPRPGWWTAAVADAAAAVAAEEAAGTPVTLPARPGHRQHDAFPLAEAIRSTPLRSRYHATRIEWERADGMSGALDLGDLTEIRLVASEDGVNAAWLNPPVPECRVQCPVDDDHFPCRVPGESAGLFTARCLGEIRDV
jgi:hypothetical protein